MAEAITMNPAQAYENYFVPAMFFPWATILIRHAEPHSGERVLDAACGTGIVSRLAAPLVGAGGQVVGLDFNAAMLAVARAIATPRGASISWQQGNAMSLPFPENSFDLVLCQHGLQFFPDRLVAVKEMHRVLVAGGRVAVIVLQSLEQHPVFEALMKSVAKHLSLPLSQVMTPFSMSNAEELQKLFKAAGFQNVKVVVESTVVCFRQAEDFVSLAVTSSAAAVPAFAQLETPARAALLDAIKAEVEPIIKPFRQESTLTFPMFAHIALVTS